MEKISKSHKHNIGDGVHVHESSSCASCPHVLVVGTVCVVEHLPPWVCCLHASCELMLHCWPQFSLSVVLFDPVTPSGISHLFFNPSYRRQRPLRPSHTKKEKTVTVLHHTALNDAPSQPPAEEKITRERLFGWGVTHWTNEAMMSLWNGSACSHSVT